MSSSFRLMRRLPQGRWTKTTATTTTTTLETPEQDEQQQQAQKPRKRPCALPTGQLTDRTDKPTNRPTEPNSNQRQRHNNPNQQRRPTTTDNRPVNRQTPSNSNSGYLVVQLSSTVREIRAGNSAGLVEVEVAPGGRSEIQQVSASGGRLGWAAGLITHYRLPNSNERTTPGTPTGALIAHAWR